MTEETILINSLSDKQEVLITFLPIPSAILSICGSCTIIYVAYKEKSKKKWTPYTRLLLGMSVSDIIVSMALAVANFLRPRDSSVRHFALGNDATCSALGFVNQIGVAAYFYNACLAIYFVLTARFGYKNNYISQCIEPFMHFISIGYPLMAAAVGSVIEVWGETPVVSLGCYLIESRLHLMFFGIPMLGTFALLVCCNFIVAAFVWKATRSSVASISSGRSKKAPKIVDDREEVTGETTLTPRSKRRYKTSATTLSGSDTDQKMQNHRLRLVCSQALLYVGGFFLSNVWLTVIKRRLSTTTNTEQERLDFMIDNYGLMLLAAFLHPSQGIFNCFIFLRPKFWKARQQHPEETSIWAVRRAVFGDDIVPSSRGQIPSSLKVKGRVVASGEKEEAKPPPDLYDDDDEEKVEADTESMPNRPAGDFDSWLEAVVSKSSKNDSETRNSNKPRRHRSSVDMWSKPVTRSSTGRGSSLEVISEISASVFEPVDFGPIEEGKSSAEVSVSSAEISVTLPLDQSERRWSSNSSHGLAEITDKARGSLSPTPPQRMDTEVDLSYHSEEDSIFEDVGPPAITRSVSLPVTTSRGRRLSKDTLMLVPRRSISPPDMMLIDNE